MHRRSKHTAMYMLDQTRHAKPTTPRPLTPLQPLVGCTPDVIRVMLTPQRYSTEVTSVPDNQAMNRWQILREAW